MRPRTNPCVPSRAVAIIHTQSESRHCVGATTLAENNRAEPSRDRPAKRARQRRHNLIAGTIIGSVFGLAVALLAFAAWDEGRCFEVHPSQFLAQVRLIKPGMTAGEVTALVRWATDTKTVSGCLAFAMRPNRMPIVPIARVMFINVYLDEAGHVVRVTAGDG